MKVTVLAFKGYKIINYFLLLLVLSLLLCYLLVLLLLLMDLVISVILFVHREFGPTIYLHTVHCVHTLLTMLMKP